jgi:hypothetical protein
MDAWRIRAPYTRVVVLQLVLTPGWRIRLAALLAIGALGCARVQCQRPANGLFMDAPSHWAKRWTAQHEVPGNRS